MKFDALFCPAYEYDAYRPTRLPTASLEESCIYSFMMRLRGWGPEAFRVPASLEQVRHLTGSLAVQLSLKNQDFQELLRNSGHVNDGLWTPAADDPLRIESYRVRVKGVEGYFLPYDDQVSGEDLFNAATFERELTLI